MACLTQMALQLHVIKFTSILDMEQCLSSLSISLHVNLFELLAVQLSKKLL